MAAAFVVDPGSLNNRPSFSITTKLKIASVSKRYSLTTLSYVIQSYQNTV